MTQRTVGPQPRLSRRMMIGLAIAGAFLLVVIVGQLGMNQGGSPTSITPESMLTSAPADSGVGAEVTSAHPYDSPVVRRQAADPMALGDLNALVVLIQWTDLRCPFCAAFDQNTLPTIIDEYVNEGLVRIEVHDVAYFGEQSEDAAVAARAAGNQGMFFEYLNAVFAEAPEKSHPDLPRDALIVFAEKAGVPDIAQFTTDLDDADLRAAVRQSTLESQQWGVTAVPFFVAGDTGLSGAQPTSVFRQFLDEAVEKVNQAAN